MRKNIVAGNWKMNLTPSESESLVIDILKKLEKRPAKHVEAIIAPPFTSLDCVWSLIKGIGKVLLAGQNCHHEEGGAYTGEVSVGMLSDLGAKYVILGHSERRKYFNETDELIRQKMEIVLSHNLTPIYCCGEQLENRQNDNHFEVVEEQIKTALFDFSDEDLKSIVIAYEPVWAIGTGRTASPDQAQEIHHFIRTLISENYSNQVASEITILYGGSCKPTNAKGLFSQPDIDGGLIGGASLSASDFVEIIHSF